MCKEKKLIRLIYTTFFLLLCAISCSPMQLPVLNAKPIAEPTLSIDTVISMLSSPDLDTRKDAVMLAMDFTDDPDKEKLVAALAETLNDSDRHVRTQTAQSLRYLGIYHQQVIEILTSWLTDDNCSDEEVLQAIQTLGAFPKQASGAIPGLISIVMTKKPTYPSPLYQHIRQAAIETLSKIRDPIAIPYLLSIFISQNELIWLRKSAAIGLSKYGPAANCSVPFVVSALDSPEPDIRIGSAIIINRTTKNSFPNGEVDNWDSQDFKEFTKDRNSEFLIVSAARKWWDENGQHQEWRPCDNGLDGKPVLP